jgi:peroxin-5
MLNQQMLMMQYQQQFFSQFIEEDDSVLRNESGDHRQHSGKVSSKEAQRRQDIASSAAIRKAYTKQMQDVLKDYNDIWVDRQNAEYSATKEGYEEAWNRLTERLETDEYTFRPDNPYDNEDDTFEMGMRMFAEGNIEGAILAFEASTRKLEDDSESWRMLGLCHAEVDDDRRAILALEKSVECDPYNLDALISLGTSYVNEGDAHRALATLQLWINHHPKFQGLSVAPDEYSDGTLTDKLQQLMAAAKAWAPDDADVSVVMGILHNATQDFRYASDSFHEALRIRPDSYSIWNKVRRIN